MNNANPVLKGIISAAAATTLIFCMSSCNDRKSLEEGFDNPPADYRPMTWWHWMNGNVTKDGIRKDLQWMHRSGISGVFLFDAGMNMQQVVEKRLPYMSEEWKDAFRFTSSLADSLGLTLSIASSPGWSLTGGPWVSEDDAQKKLVWSVLEVEGGPEGQNGRFCGTLPTPPDVAGPYLDEPAFPKDPDKHRYYRDVCVIAVKAPAKDTARIVRSEVKAGFKMDYTVSDHFPTPETDDVTAPADVIDLTGSYSDGKLTWDVPEGKWKIFRFGYSLIGHINGPATPEATGLEVDKLDHDAVQRYFHNYFNFFGSALTDDRDDASKALEGHIYALQIDSYESGKSTWTPKLEDEFRSRRGYELRPWLPVLTGQIIGSAEASERFLFDWRQTLGELLAENHYDSVNDIVHPMGMLRFSEAHEERTAFTGDGMMVKRSADVPMSAFWVRYRAGWYSSYPTSDADIRESSSVAHIYGQNVCAAESFTTNGRIGKWDGFGAYQCHPGNLKPVADMAMACGLNKFVMHTSVHQPTDDKIPGLGLSTYGQWFTRHDTWADEARVWTDYLSRSCYMLRQGRYVADIAYFYGEDKNVTGRFMDERVSIPDGYNFDFVNGDIILNVLRLNGKRLETAGGIKYSLLRIDPQVRYISMPVLRRIAEFARAGVAICGPKPERCANLMADDGEFSRLADEIWSMSNVTDVDLAEALAAAGIREDVKGLPDSVEFIHRSIPGGDIYWIANISASPREFTVSLRTKARNAEIWHADTGLREGVPAECVKDYTSVRLDMVRDDAQFIVLYRNPFTRTAPARRELSGETPVTVEGPWKVAFQEGRGAPETAVYDSLESFTQSPDPGIRYFSGKAIYSTRFVYDSPGTTEETWIDLGDVRNMARIRLNGTDLGLAWKYPFLLDTKGALRQGENELEVTVTDSWANRLIGDEQPETGKRITFTAVQFYTADSPLVPSGLLGPVRIVR